MCFCSAASSPPQHLLGEEQVTPSIRSSCQGEGSPHCLLIQVSSQYFQWRRRLYVASTTTSSPVSPSPTSGSLSCAVVVPCFVSWPWVICLCLLSCWACVLQSTLILSWDNVLVIGRFYSRVME